MWDILDGLDVLDDSGFRYVNELSVISIAVLGKKLMHIKIFDFLKSRLACGYGEEKLVYVTLSRHGSNQENTDRITVMLVIYESIN